MAQIHINQNTCIRCKKCVRICPSALFTLQEGKGIEVNADDCISWRTLRGRLPHQLH